MLAQNLNLRSSLSMGAAITHVVLWIVISIVTLGIGLAFWPYAASKLLADTTTVLDASGTIVGRLECRLSAGSQIGHIILWYVLCLVTLGLALPFYYVGVARVAIAATTLRLENQE